MTTLSDIQRRVGVIADGVLGPTTLAAIAKALGMTATAVPATGQRRIGPKGLALIKRFEGLKLKAYKCPADVWTIGYGSTGAHVKPGMVITEAQAEALLRDDLARFEKAVLTMAPVATQEQFDAMVSLAFNVGEGEGGFKTSTLRRLHNEGKYADAALQFARWNRAGGRVLAGLTRRRADEAALYRSSGT